MTDKVQCSESDVPYCLYLCEDTETIVDLLPSSSSYVGDVAGGHRGEHGAHRVPVRQEDANMRMITLSL